MQKTRKTVSKRFKVTKNQKVTSKKKARNHLKSCKSKKQLSKYKNSRAVTHPTQVKKVIISNLA